MSEESDSRSWKAVMDDLDSAWDAVQEMFPEANFSICFDKETIESELSKERTIFLVIKHRCYCYSEESLPNTYVQVNRKSGSSAITYGDAVRALVDYEYNPCSHYFLQYFRHVEGTIQYEAHFGS